MSVGWATALRRCPRVAVRRGWSDAWARRYAPLPTLRNHDTMAFQITLAISEKPEIGRAVAGDGCAAGACAGTAGRSAICAFRLPANWFMICAAVAWMMPTPRPYWATAPESARSVWTSTLEPPPAGSSRNEALALAAPRPLASLP